MGESIFKKGVLRGEKQILEYYSTEPLLKLTLIPIDRYTTSTRGTNLLKPAMDKNNQTLRYSTKHPILPNMGLGHPIISQFLLVCHPY